MSIINFYESMPTKYKDIPLPNPNKELHGFDIPFRMVVASPSGGGKTLFITNLINLFSQGRGTFSSCTIITKNKDEPLYRFLESKSEQIRILEGLNNLPNLDTFDRETASLVIIDDSQNDKNQEKIMNFYIRGRKLNVSIAYLCQNFYVCPKVIRSNCNYLVILRLSGDRELKMILKEVSLGVDKETLLNMYKYATNEKFHPLVVNIESFDDTKKYRKGFVDWLDPKDF